MKTLTADQLSALPDASRDVVVVSTHFAPDDKMRVQPPGARSLPAETAELLGHCVRLLKENGLLFVYGLPVTLAVVGAHLRGVRGGNFPSQNSPLAPVNRSRRREEAEPGATQEGPFCYVGGDQRQVYGKGWQMEFKYWFALDIDAAPAAGLLPPSHLGLLLFGRARSGKRGPKLDLRLDVDAVRTPHQLCAACGNTLKDWGGKRHLMNPKGAAVSDVWRDLPRRVIKDSIIPADVLARVAALATGESRLHVVQGKPPHSSHVVEHQITNAGCRQTPAGQTPAPATFANVQPDWVYHGDCVAFLDRVAGLHPAGLFDLAFADPPYNLAKSYDTYADELAEHQYLEWCDAWLTGMARTLKPGGSLFVLNLPKWALHHAVRLNQQLEFRHWIVWDALSDPRGKIMPAHYALLWYTKPGAPAVCNYAGLKARPPAAADSRVSPPDAPKYCLRAACVRDRKARGDDEKVELTDLWFDVHRIKHKRDRDAHPCQLPDKLMERIIRLASPPNGWVFDPFCGAGTTALAATKLGRKFCVTDVDEKYVRITREKLAAMKRHADLFGETVLRRERQARPRPAASKREVELYLQQLARKLGRVPTEAEVAADQPTMLAKIDAAYPYRSAAFKRARVALAPAVAGS